jgi:hypothetical protein
VQALNGRELVLVADDGSRPPHAALPVAPVGSGHDMAGAETKRDYSSKAEKGSEKGSEKSAMNPWIWALASGLGILVLAGLVLFLKGNNMNFNNLRLPDPGGI